VIYADDVHLISDTSLEELHLFAESIGIKRCWYHSSSSWIHYDIPKRMRPGFHEKFNVTKVTSQEIVKLLTAANLRNPH